MHRGLASAGALLWIILVLVPPTAFIPASAQTRIANREILSERTLESLPSEAVAVDLSESFMTRDDAPSTHSHGMGWSVAGFLSWHVVALGTQRIVLWSTHD